MFCELQPPCLIIFHFLFQMPDVALAIKRVWVCGNFKGNPPFLCYLCTENCDCRCKVHAHFSADFFYGFFQICVHAEIYACLCHTSHLLYVHLHYRKTNMAFYNRIQRKRCALLSESKRLLPIDILYRVLDICKAISLYFCIFSLHTFLFFTIYAFLTRLFYSSTTHLSKAYAKKVPISSFLLCPVLEEISSICATISSLILIEKTLYPSSPFAFLGFITKLSFFILHLRSTIFYA